MYLSVITVVIALLPASFLLICANVSSHSYAKHLCLFDLVTLVMLLAGDYFLLQICNAAGNPPAVTVVRVKFHCLLSAVNPANCAAASRAGGQPPLDPARAVKIHGRGSGPTQTQLKSTQWREVQSLHNWCDNMRKHMQKNRRENPMRAIKDSQPVHLWAMDVSQEARATLRKLWLSQEAARVRKACKRKVQIVIHCHPHSSACRRPAVGREGNCSWIPPEIS